MCLLNIKPKAVKNVKRTVGYVATCLCPCTIYRPMNAECSKKNVGVHKLHVYFTLLYLYHHCHFFCIQHALCHSMLSINQSTNLINISSRSHSKGVVFNGILRKGSNCANLCPNTLFNKCIKFSPKWKTPDPFLHAPGTGMSAD